MATVDIQATGGFVGCWTATADALWDSTTGGAPDNTSEWARIGAFSWTVSDFIAQQALWAFDTSVTNIPAGAVVDGVVLHATREAWGDRGGGTQDVYLYDWSPAMDASDLQNHTELTALYNDGRRVAYRTIPTNADGILSFAFTSESAFVNGLTRGGSTYLLVTHSEARTAETWDGDPNMGLAMPACSTAAYRPYLTVTYHMSGVVRSGLVAEYVGKWAKSKVDGQFGLSSVSGAAGMGLSGSGYGVGSAATLASPQSISKVTAYIDPGGASNNYVAYLCAASGSDCGSVLAVTAATAVSGALGWFEFAFSTPYAASAGDYWICLQGQNSNGYPQYGAATGRHICRASGTYPNGVTVTDWIYTDYALIAYATYTTALAPGNNADPTTTWKNLHGGYDAAVNATKTDWGGSGTEADPYYLVPNVMGTDEFHVPALEEAGVFPLSSTVEFWANLGTGNTNYPALWENYSSTQAAHIFARYTSSGTSLQVCCQLPASYPASYIVATTTGLHHVVITFDNTSKAFGFYIDGSPVSGSPKTATGFSPTEQKVTFFDAYGTPVVGTKLSTLRIYERPLTAAEVAQNYAAGPCAASLQDQSSLIAIGRF